MCADVERHGWKPCPFTTWTCQQRMRSGRRSLFRAAGRHVPAQQSSQTPYTLKPAARSCWSTSPRATRRELSSATLPPTISPFSKTASRRRSRRSTSRTPTPCPRPPPVPNRPPCSRPLKPRAEAKPAEVQPHQPSALKDRRLLILFFDLSAMQPDEIDRSLTAAQKYVDQQMAPGRPGVGGLAGQHVARGSGFHQPTGRCSSRR